MYTFSKGLSETSRQSLINRRIFIPQQTTTPRHLFKLILPLLYTHIRTQRNRFHRTQFTREKTSNAVIYNLHTAAPSFSSGETAAAYIYLKINDCTRVTYTQSGARARILEKFRRAAACSCNTCARCPWTRACVCAHALYDFFSFYRFSGRASFVCSLLVFSLRCFSSGCRAV